MMRFPKKYMKQGDFTLHSGLHSKVFYDVNALLTDFDEFGKIMRAIPECDCYVGIATGGAIIASHLWNWAMVKDGELKGEITGEYCIVDDVVTTETSIRECIEAVGRPPQYIFVVVDRRRKNDKKLKIHSMYKG